MFLMENGEVYRNGETSNGELGTGQTQGDRNGFYRVHGLEDTRIIKTELVILGILQNKLWL